MPGPFKCQYIFAAEQNGWSETWYTALGANAQDAAGRFSTTVAARQALLGTPCYIEAIRVTDLDGNLPAQLITYSKPNFAGGQLNATSLRDNAANSVHVRLKTADASYFRTAWLRGCPDFWIEYQKSGQEVLAGAMRNAMVRWVATAKVAQLKLSWHALDKAGTSRVARKIVDNLTFTPGLPVLYHCAAHGLEAGDYVRVGGLKGRSLEMKPPSKGTPNGVQLVLGVPSADTFVTELHSDQFPADAKLYTVGWATARPDLYPQIDNWDFIGFSRKKVGRRFFVSRGRRSANKGG